MSGFSEPQIARPTLTSIQVLLDECTPGDIKKILKYLNTYYSTIEELDSDD